jgi:hypothetical protein
MPSSTCDPANDTGTASTEYLVCQPEGAPFSIRMHRDAIDGIARDILEQKQPQPAITPEVGGLLLGRIVSGNVWIDRFQRIVCRHEEGPRWALNDAEREALESSAREILETGEHSIVGFFRSHTRPGTPLQADQSDLDLIGRYFADATDLVLLIRPADSPGSTVQPGPDLEARFFTRTGSSQTPDGDRRVEPAGPMFAFQGRGINLTTVAEPDAEATRQTPIPFPVPRFTAPEPAPLSAEAHTSDMASSYTESNGHGWWPMLAAACVVGLIAAFFLLPAGWPNLHKAATATVVREPVRPLGLSVNPEGSVWRISWNPNATALNGARSVQLFVREGDDQNRIDLSPGDLASGTYQYHPASSDVTFRLEVTEPSGAIAAESYRFRQTQAPAPPAPAVDRTAPRPIQRVAPVVGAGVRQRIPGIVPLDIRVTVDRKGRVLTAEPVTRPRDSLHKYLSDRAVAAARQWRFEPARVGGQPADGEETIHFVFQK